MVCTRILPSRKNRTDFEKIPGLDRIFEKNTGAELLEKPDPDPTFEKKTRIRIRPPRKNLIQIWILPYFLPNKIDLLLISFDIKVIIIDNLTQYHHFCQYI